MNDVASVPDSRDEKRRSALLVCGEKVGRGPGRRSDPVPMKVSRPRQTGAVLPASPGGMRAAVRA